jgi:aspartyl-tRNA(Asn)/glutamyl-tRNA(Gln) amidotransferase subunit A
MNNMELGFSTIASLKKKLAAKEISPAELLAYTIKRFEQHDGKIRSALEIFDAESILKASGDKGTLAGIPGLIKDNICQKGRIASAGSKILEKYRAPYDATVVAKLKAEGALLIGRANQDEFGMGGSNENSAYFPTHNPWDTTRVPGGSGGGSAAAVAAGLVPFALGTETGGSVRQPAAFCGGVGMKTTYNIMSRYGVIAYGSSLDQVGINTRTVHDNAMVLSTMAGHDPKDSTSLKVAAKDYTQGLTGKLRSGLKIGVIQNAINAEGMDGEVRASLDAAVAQFEKLGATIKPITIPSFDYSAAVYFIVSRAEAASNLARFDGVKYGFRAKGAANLKDMYFQTRGQGFGAEVRRRILIGNYVLSAGHAAEFYGKACKVRELMRYELNQAFADVDLLFLPTSAAPAFKFGAFDENRLQMDLQDYFTAPASLTKLPALAVPCGFTASKLPIGFQLMGPELSEELLYQAAHAYEVATPWHTMHPAGF